MISLDDAIKKFFKEEGYGISEIGELPEKWVFAVCYPDDPDQVPDIGGGAFVSKENGEISAYFYPDCYEEVNKAKRVRRKMPVLPEKQ